MENSGVMGLYLSLGRCRSRLEEDYPDKSKDEIDIMLANFQKEREASAGGTVEDLNVPGAQKYWYADKQSTEAGDEAHSYWLHVLCG